MTTLPTAGLALANKLQQKRVAKECAAWIENKVDIRTIRQSNLLHGKLYHVETCGVEEAILGRSNFTVRGLGLGDGNNNIELNLIVDSNRDRQELKQWFAEVWSDEKRMMCRMWTLRLPQDDVFLLYTVNFAQRAGAQGRK